MFFVFFSIFWRTFTKTKLPVIKRQSSFIVESDEVLEFDFSSYQESSSPYQYDNGNLHYIVRFAKELTSSDIPSYGTSSLSSRKRVNAVKCDDNEQKCYPLSTIYEYDWTTILDTNIRTGVLYIADGEPFRNGNGEYEEWEVHFEFRCNESSQSNTPRMFTDIPVSNMPRLYVSFSNQLSCGKNTQQRPSPTPHFEPDCTVHYRQDGGELRKAIYFDLSEWNGGALGIPFEFQDTTSRTTRFIFWEPCGRMVNCPWGANCGGETLSSAWLCNADITSCENFTIIPASDTISYVDSDLIDGTNINNGVRFKYEQGTNGKLYVDVTCDPDYPNDHVNFEEHPYMTYDPTTKTITLQAKAYDICPVNQPEPVPPYGQCKFNLTQDGPQHNTFFIDMDLAATSSVKALQVEGRGEISGTYELYYAPCDTIPCPDGYDCDGDEDAYVYLCDNTTKIPLCTAYGLPTRDMSIGIKGGWLPNGVTVTYLGDRGRKASVDFKCNRSMLSYRMNVSPVVHVDHGTISIDAQMINACMDGTGPTPTPPPFIRIAPKKPTPKKVPTPVPSPRAVYLIESANKEKYVLVDLTQLSKTTAYEGDNDFYYDGQTSSIHTEFHSWKSFAYPDGWVSDTIFEDPALAWQCWFDESFKPYCHPVGDKSYPGLNVQLQKPGDIDSGVIITYHGVYETTFSVHIDCNQSLTGRLNLDKKQINYTDNGNGQWSVRDELESVCANKYVPWTTPSPTQTPAPPEDYTPQTVLIETVGDYDIKFDMSLLETADVYAASGASGFYSRVHYYFSPVKKISSPLQGATYPEEYHTGNAWACNDTYCYPIANLDYGLVLSLFKKGDLNQGIAAAYEGGLYNSQANFIFYCDPTVKKNQMEIRPVVTVRNVGGHNHNFEVYTSNICPVVSSTATGGGYFLLVLGLLFVGYFGLGTPIIYVAKGVVEVPFESFWIEFFECVITAIVFIFTCGKSRTTAAYNNI